MDIARIADVAAGEAERQQTDFNGYVRLLNAYRWAYENRDAELNMHHVFAIAMMVEPYNERGYRITPVTFANGGHAVDWNLIPTAMSQWFDMVNDLPSLNGTPESVREMLVREFLRIHPFIDGNGRIAWILRTRFYDNWESPNPLPKYFPGE